MFDTIRSVDGIDMQRNSSSMLGNTTRNIINIKRNVTNKKIVGYIKEKMPDDGKLVDLPDPDKYIYKEDELIRNIRMIKEEERRKRENEIALKIKNDKVKYNFYLLKEINEKLAEQVKKQKEFERKNVTADCNGAVIPIKFNSLEKLSNDFLHPKLNIREEVKPEPNFNKDKENLETVSADSKTKANSEEIENKKKDERKKGRNVGTTNPHKYADGSKSVIYIENRSEDDSKHQKNIMKENKYIIQPAGSNFDIIIPEVGVTILEAAKTKSGGKDFSTIFQKPSKYDYQQMAKENVQKPYGVINNSSILKKTFANTNSNNDFSNTSNVNLPLLQTNNKYESRNINSTLQIDSHTFNKSVDTMRVSNKLTATLKSTLEILDLLPNYNELSYPSNNVDIFKKRKTYLQEKDENEKKTKESLLEEINKFNLNIINNERWGGTNAEKSKPKEAVKVPVKPDKKDLEREVGIKMMKKLPRSRVSNSLSNFK